MDVINKAALEAIAKSMSKGIAAEIGVLAFIQVILVGAAFYYLYRQQKQNTETLKEIKADLSATTKAVDQVGKNQVRFFNKFIGDVNRAKAAMEKKQGHVGIDGERPSAVSERYLNKPVAPRNVKQ